MLYVWKTEWYSPNTHFELNNSNWLDNLKALEQTDYFNDSLKPFESKAFDQRFAFKKQNKSIRIEENSNLTKLFWCLKSGIAGTVCSDNPLQSKCQTFSVMLKLNRAKKFCALPISQKKSSVSEPQGSFLFWNYKVILNQRSVIIVIISKLLNGPSSTRQVHLSNRIIPVWNPKSLDELQTCSEQNFPWMEPIAWTFSALAGKKNTPSLILSSTCNLWVFERNRSAFWVDSTGHSSLIQRLQMLWNFYSKLNLNGCAVLVGILAMIGTKNL